MSEPWWHRLFACGGLLTCKRRSLLNCDFGWGTLAVPDLDHHVLYSAQSRGHDVVHLADCSLARGTPVEVDESGLPANGNRKRLSRFSEACRSAGGRGCSAVGICGGHIAVAGKVEHANPAG